MNWCDGVAATSGARVSTTGEVDILAVVGCLEKGSSRMKLNVRQCRNFLVSSICLSFVIFPATSQGAELSKETLQAWDAYVQTANSQMINRTRGSFLWLDEVPNRSHSVHDGTILVSPIGQQNPKPVPFGLIHDWIGAVYIPNAKLRDVLFTARDYSHYKEFYKPNVIDSKSLGTV